MPKSWPIAVSENSGLALSSRDAIHVLESHLARIPGLKGQTPDSTELQIWRDASSAAVRKAFGTGSDEAKRFENAQSFVLAMRPWGKPGWNDRDQAEIDNSLVRAEAVLTEFIVELRRRATAMESSGVGRRKSEKFGILDSPAHTATDLTCIDGTRGAGFIYLDIDDFKRLNTAYTETVVDEAVLPPLQRLIASTVSDWGFAYAEGGDEITILLPNVSRRMAMAVAEEVRLAIAELSPIVNGDTLALTASLGLAHTTNRAEFENLPKRANEAKRTAKERGKNRTCIYAADGHLDASVVWREGQE
jgi:diguanylate cyclase (GGDEF)-like protein